MSRSLATPVLPMALVWGTLVLWSASAQDLSCPVTGLFLVAVGVLLTFSATEVAFFRRRAFLEHYLDPEGTLFRLLSGRVLLLLRHTAGSLVLALALLVASQDFSLLEWTLLGADVLLMAALMTGFSRLLDKEVRSPYAEPMARLWALRSNAVLLWAALVCAGFFSAHADYNGLLWEEVAVLGASAAAPGCDALAVLARGNGVVQALTFWAAQNLFDTLRQPEQILVAWLVFVASFGVSFLAAWVYSRALAGVLSHPFRIWPKARESR